jgi:virulence factor Mce-like protein
MTTTVRTPPPPRRRDPVRHRARAGAVTIAAIALVAWLTLNAPNGVPGTHHRTATVYLPDVGSLRAHNDVRTAGVLIGQVKDVELSGTRAKVTLRLSGAAGRIPADSTAAVRSAGLLGQRYLQIIRGTSTRALPDGGTLRAASRSITLGVPEALETFDAATRGGLGQSVRGLGTGVLGEGQHINDAVDAGPQAATDFRTTADAILAEDAAAPLLMPRLADAAGALDDSREQIATLLRPTARALTPLVDQRDAVRRTLDLAPPTLAAARPGLAAANRLLVTVHRLADAASDTLPKAPAALRATTALLRDGRQPLRDAAPLVHQADTTIPKILQLTGAVSPVLAPLREPLDRLQSPLDILGEHGCDVVNFARVWRSFLGFGSVPGGKIGTLGEIRAEAIVNMPLAGAGDGLKLPDALSERDVYPAPCKYAGSVHPTLP